jgi:LuxR family maltose regulon positive regulatory protein
MGDLCKALLDMTLGNTRGLPEWLRDADRIRRLFYVQGHSYVFMLHGMMLLLEGRRAELYGLTDPLLKMAHGSRFLLPQVYQHIYLAVAKKNESDSAQAMEHLSAALDLALPDDMYLPFAEFGAVLLPLLETFRTGIHGKSFDAEKMAALKALCRRQMAGVESIARHNAKKKSPLTAGEREIALLAKERLSVSEIASHRNLTESTVKSVLRTIFSKLEIHSKKELAKKDF